MQQVRAWSPVDFLVDFTSFRSVNGIFFTFPSQYLYAIDQKCVIESFEVVLKSSSNLSRGLLYLLANIVRQLQD